MKLNQVYFRAHSVEYRIELNEPIEGVSYHEIREKAKKEVELYMLNNSIPGPYELIFL